MKSIRRTLFVRLAGGGLLLLILGALLLCAGVRFLLTQQFDATLRHKLSTFATLLEQDGWQIELDFVNLAMPEFSAKSEPEYTQIWLPQGKVLFRSESLGNGDLPRFAGTETEPLIQDLVLPDGRAGRAIGAQFVVHHYVPGPKDPGAAELVLVLAKGRASLDHALAWLWGGTTAGILLLLFAGILLGRNAVVRGLQPIEDLARHVRAIDDPASARSFPRHAVPGELAPLAESHNQMLERIRAAFERERRTTANIAHELRTPVAEFLLLAETAQGHVADVPATVRRLGELREIGQQMAALIATLLELARLESGQSPLEIEAIDLPELVRACWSPLSGACTAKCQTFHVHLGQDLSVQADRAALSILLTNLLGNAVDHGPAGDRIECTIEHAPARTSLVISNTAAGLVPEDLEHLTEAFWRASRSREDRAHAGLGLALAHRLAQLLGFPLRFVLHEGTFQAHLEMTAAAVGAAGDDRNRQAVSPTHTTVPMNWQAAGGGG